MKILVAEDGAVMRHLLERSLRAWNYEVVAAADGAQAWDLFRGDDFPLVLTDWIMPHLDGLELIRLIRGAELPHYVYIILLTAKSDKEDLVAGMDCGADDFLAKPVDPDELRVRLRQGARVIQLERRLAEKNRRLRETQAALVQSEKLASLGQLAAGMAHEINNPVSYVANNLAVLRRDVLSAMEILSKYRQHHTLLSQSYPDWWAEVARLEEACDLDWTMDNLPRMLQASLEGLSRVRQIVKNLRDFARLDEAQWDELDVNRALEATVEILHHDLDEKGVELLMELAPVPPVLGRPDKLHQVFHSLLLNAIQASQPGDRVWIRTLPRGDGVVVEIQDEGCGIDAAHLPHLFEPFFTTRPVGRGRGLGLAISYGIVRDHGGAIEVESRRGTGSCFRVQLPLEPPQLRPPAPTPTARPAAESAQVQSRGNTTR